MSLLGGNRSSAFPWSSLTDVTTKDCPATAHRNILSRFHCRRSLFRTKHKSANDAWNQWALFWQFACHSISSSCTVNAKSKEMHHDTVHNPSQCLLLCTEVDQCLWLQRFIIQNAEDVSVINCVFACDVRVLPNLLRILNVDKVAWVLYILIWKVLWMESEMLFVSFFFKKQKKRVLEATMWKGVPFYFF